MNKTKNGHLRVQKRPKFETFTATRRPEIILRPELVVEMTFHKHKPLCKSRARFEDPSWEPIHISYEIILDEHQKDVDNERNKPVPNHRVGNHKFNFNKVSIMDSKLIATLNRGHD